MPGSRAQRAWPLVAMAAGLVVLAAAAAIVLRAGDGSRAARQAAPVIASAPADPTAITVSARDVAVVMQVYEPGQQSGWHAHPGIHAVAVLSGVLSVYDEQCQLHTFEPGRPYVGGQLPHLVRNDTDAPVAMSVTYLNPPQSATSTEHVARPAGCTTG